MAKITRHFSSTTYVGSRKGILLHYHKKLMKWLPVGGHIDKDELPTHAAIREAKEETGLNIDLITPRKLTNFQNGSEIVNPFHTMIHKINDSHEHIDLVFFGKCTQTEFILGAGESPQLKWFSHYDLTHTSSLHDDVKKFALEALGIFNCISETQNTINHR